MLSDKDFRSAVIDEIEDPVLLNFWLNEFSQYSKGHRTEALAPIQNKLGEFALNFWTASLTVGISTLTAPISPDASQPRTRSESRLQ